MYKLDYPDGKPIRKEWRDSAGKLQSRRRRQRAFDEMRGIEMAHQLKQVEALESYQEYAPIAQMIRNEFDA